MLGKRFLVAVVSSGVLVGACTSTGAPGSSGADDVKVNEELLSGSLPYRGVNLAGAEFGVDAWGNGNGDYVYPDPAYASGYNSADYFIQKGMTTFRLPFRWERLQPNRRQPLDGGELDKLRTTVKHLTDKGAYVLIDPHNYARYWTNVLGAGVSNEDFADFWGRLAAEFKDNSRVLFGLMNEPHDMATEAWVGAANSAIAAIRGAGASNLILVPGNGWTGAHSWSESWYGTPNAQALLDIRDPNNNVAFEAHQYLDSDSSGTSAACSGPTVGSERMQPFTAWLRANGKKGFLGEFGGGGDGTCQAAIDDIVKHLEQNSDVYLGWTYWAAGPWWGDYFTSLEPNGGDKPQMNALARHLGGGGAGGTTSFDPNGVYKIVAKHSGKALDIFEARGDNGTKVQQWDYWGGDNQKWRLIDLGDGSYEIVSKQTGKVIDVEGISKDAGAAIHEWDWLSGPNQKWEIVSTGGGFYEIVSRNSGMTVDVSGASNDNGAPILQWPYHGGDNQQWSIVRVE